MTHRFSKGQSVQLKSEVPSKPQINYDIVGTLPLKDGSPQYRIRNQNEDFERVIAQELIVLTSELAERSPPDTSSYDFMDAIKISRKSGSNKR